MTEKQEAALRQAREALKESHPEAYRHTLAAIDEALADQPAQQDYWQEEARRYAQNAEFWRGKYEAATAQQQEPVVWMYQNKSTHEVSFQKHMRSFVDHGAWYEVPLYSEPLANQEKTSGSPKPAKPEALRLAELFEVAANAAPEGDEGWLKTAAELRRMHDLLGKANALCRIRAEEIERLKAQPEQEPVAWADLNALTEQFNSVNCGTAYRLPGENRQPLYTSPPASKPWVGLTQQDINIAFDDTQEGGGFNEFARAIEAKLREKNAQPSKPLTDEQRKAIVVCFTSGKVSVSEVQRKLAISYNEAQQLCQSIVDLKLAQGLQLAPSLDRHGIKGDA